MAENPLTGQCVYRPKGQIHCIHHSRKKVKLFCEECQELVCIQCVASVQHRGHIFHILKDIIPSRREKIQHFIDVTEKSAFPTIDHNITKAKAILHRENLNFDDLENEVSKQREQLKQDIDLLTDSIIKFHQHIKQTNIDNTETYIKNQEKARENFKHQIQECKDALQKGSFVEVYDIWDEICDLSLGSLPDAPTLGSATFVPNKNPYDYLKQCIGTVTILNQPESMGEANIGHSYGHHQSYSQQQSSDSHSQSTTSEQLGGDHQPSSTQTYNSTGDNMAQMYRLPVNTKLITEFKSPCRIDAISTTNDESIYVCSRGHKTVKLINKKGEVRAEIEYKTMITDVRISSTTQHVWACSHEDWSVIEYEPLHSPVVMFNTDNEPRCMCVTVDDCILIGMSGEMIKYNTEGKVLLKTKPSKSGQSIVISPKRISQCSLTHNIAIADLDNKDDGGDDKPHLLVTGENLEEMFRFNGDIPIQYQTTIEGKQEAFYPWDVRYDSDGNIVISDFNRYYIHLLSARGDYIRPIYTGDALVGSIGIDVNNELWVNTGYRPSQVKLLQYSDTDS